MHTPFEDKGAAMSELPVEWLPIGALEPHVIFYLAECLGEIVAEKPIASPL
jgi:hypothetical protein